MRKTITPHYLGSFSLNQCRKITIQQLYTEAKQKLPDIMRILYP